MDFTTLDIVFCVILLIAAIRCAFKGFIGEVMSTAAIVLAVVGALVFSNQGAELLAPYLGVSYWNKIIAFLVIFLVVYLVVKLIEGILYKVLEKIRLEKLDKALGLFLGIAEGIIIIVLIIFIMRVQPFFEVDAIVEASTVYRLINSIFPLKFEVESLSV